MTLASFPVCIWPIVAAVFPLWTVLARALCGRETLCASGPSYEQLSKPTVRDRRYYISGHQVSRSVSKSSGTIGSARKNDTYIVYMYTCEMHTHDVAYCHTLQTLIF